MGVWVIGQLSSVIFFFSLSFLQRELLFGIEGRCAGDSTCITLLSPSADLITPRLLPKFSTAPLGRNGSLSNPRNMSPAGLLSIRAAAPPNSSRFQVRRASPPVGRY